MRRRSRSSRTSRIGARSQEPESRRRAARNTLSPTFFCEKGSSWCPECVAAQVVLTPGFWRLAPLLELLQLLDLLICPRLTFGRRDSAREMHSLQEMRSPQDLDSDLRISVPPTSAPRAFAPAVASGMAYPPLAFCSQWAIRIPMRPAVQSLRSSILPN